MLPGRWGNFTVAVKSNTYLTADVSYTYSGMNLSRFEQLLELCREVRCTVWNMQITDAQHEYHRINNRYLRSIETI